MKRIIKILFITLLFLTSLCVGFSHASQEDIVTLDSAEVISLQIPESSDVILATANQNCEITTQRKNENPNYFDIDEDVFETKTGQIFSKFIDNTVINNKLNKFPSRIENELNARAP